MSVSFRLSGPVERVLARAESTEVEDTSGFHANIADVFAMLGRLERRADADSPPLRD